MSINIVISAFNIKLHVYRIRQMCDYYVSQCDIISHFISNYTIRFAINKTCILYPKVNNYFD